MLNLTMTGGRARFARLLVVTATVAGLAAIPAGPASADGVRNAQQWVLNAVHAPAAWPVTEGQGVTVAVIDSGVDPQVSDLTGSVTSGPDLTGVGTPSSNPGWGMHGTWMASLIAGHGHGGGSGIIGVAPRAHVLSIRVITDQAGPGLCEVPARAAGAGAERARPGDHLRGRARRRRDQHVAWLRQAQPRGPAGAPGRVQPRRGRGGVIRQPGRLRQRPPRTRRTPFPPTTRACSASPPSARTAPRPGSPATTCRYRSRRPASRSRRRAGTAGTGW